LKELKILENMPVLLIFMIKYEVCICIYY